MGLALAEAASQAGCDTTLLLGPANAEIKTAAAEHARVVPFTTVEDLRDKLTRLFPRHDALIMAAAVGDFRVEQVSERKIRRADGPVQLTLIPTEDVLAGVAAAKRDDQLSFPSPWKTARRMNRKPGPAGNSQPRMRISSSSIRPMR